MEEKKRIDRNEKGRINDSKEKERKQRKEKKWKKKGN